MNTTKCANCGNNDAPNGPFTVIKNSAVVFTNAYLCDVSVVEVDSDGYDLVPE